MFPFSSTVTINDDNRRLSASQQKSLSGVKWDIRFSIVAKSFVEGLIAFIDQLVQDFPMLMFLRSLIVLLQAFLLLL